LFNLHSSGQLGHGGYNDEVAPRELKFEGFVDDPVISVACGDRHTVFVTEKGKVYVCGQNFNGQVCVLIYLIMKLGLGHKSNMDKPTLSELMDRRRIRKAVCGSRHTILISSKGELYTSGWGTFGQLGHGDNIDQLYSKKMELDWQAVSVVTKEHINLALTSTIYTIL
jgi:alpha-tubulin suppressor-like RCC1 family protein